MLLESAPSFIPLTGNLTEKAFYYARTPMLLVNISGLITDINAACRVLLSVDITGCRGQHFTYLTDRIQAKIEGDFFPLHGFANLHFRTLRNEPPILETKDLNLAVAECCYQSGQFGSTKLRITELPCIDTESGVCSGSIISLDPLQTLDEIYLQTLIDHRLNHEVMWEVYAASYDRILSELPFYQEVVDRHCAAMEPTHIHTILDVGTGTGITALRLLDHDKQITAIDLSRAMLQKLYSKLKPGHDQRLTIIEDTAENLPYLPDASFDGISVLLAFFDMNDPFAALRESQRLLKSGGTLIITDPRSCFNVEQLMSAAEESLRSKGLLEQLASDWRQIQIVAPLIRDTIRDIQSQTSDYHLEQSWHAEVILEILRQQGFSNLTFRESHLGNCATITGKKT